MVMLADMPSRWTPADLRELPDDGRRYELIDGRLLVSPPAGEDHQSLCRSVLLALHGAAPEGWRVLSEIGLAIGDDRVIPDLVVLPPDTPKANADYNDVEVVRPALVIEVESPSTGPPTLATRWCSMPAPGSRLLAAAAGRDAAGAPAGHAGDLHPCRQREAWGVGRRLLALLAADEASGVAELDCRACGAVRGLGGSAPWRCVCR
jgi:hypothetical protein